MDRAVLLAELRRLANHLGGPPTQSDVNDLTARSHATYAKEFGGWNAALEAAGIGTNHEVNKERVTVECDNPDCSTEVKRLPSALENQQNVYCSQDCLNEHKRTRFSGARNPGSTLREVDCTVCGTAILRAKWERERSERYYCSECWGDSKVEVLCEWCGETTEVWPARVDSYRFCSYECAGEWRSLAYRGEDHPRWTDGHRPEYYGPNWREQRRRALRRDQARCQECGLTDQESVELYGAHLSVHHRTPLREFSEDGTLDHKRANRLENLETLCVRCHGKRGEG